MLRMGNSLSTFMEKRPLPKCWIPVTSCVAKKCQLLDSPGCQIGLTVSFIMTIFLTHYLINRYLFCRVKANFTEVKSSNIFWEEWKILNL